MYDLKQKVEFLRHWTKNKMEDPNLRPIQSQMLGAFPLQIPNLFHSACENITTVYCVKRIAACS